MKTCYLAPDSKGMANAVKREPSGVSAVQCLFSSAGPATIGFAVRSVVINAVDAFAWRHFAHVGDKLFKRVAPRLAHGNTASTPPIITECAAVVASLLDSLPDPICAASRPAVRCSPRCGHFLSQAATAFRYARNKTVSNYEKLLAAITSAFPKDASRRSVAVFFGASFVNIGNKKTAESLTGQIIEFGHVTALLSRTGLIVSGGGHFG